MGNCLAVQLELVSRRRRRQLLGISYMNEFCRECENGEYRPPEGRGVLYWILFFCTAGLFAAIHSLIQKRRLVCPACGRLYK